MAVISKVKYLLVAVSPLLSSGTPSNSKSGSVISAVTVYSPTLVIAVGYVNLIRLESYQVFCSSGTLAIVCDCPLYTTATSVGVASGK